MLLTPITIRATPADLANLATIATRLRESGETFATKTAAVQYALRVAARGCSGLGGCANRVLSAPNNLLTIKEI